MTPAISSPALAFSITIYGDLDLFVCNYVRWTKELELQIDYRISGEPFPPPPVRVPGSYSFLYRNNGEGQFTDVSQQAGLHQLAKDLDQPNGRCLGVRFFDLNRDRYPDILVANDASANFLYRNNKDGTFEEVARESGFAFDHQANLPPPWESTRHTTGMMTRLPLRWGTFPTKHHLSIYEGHTTLCN